MTPIGLKTGERAQWSAAFLISLKTGDVLELTISPSKGQPVFGVLRSSKTKAAPFRLISIIGNQKWAGHGLLSLPAKRTHSGRNATASPSTIEAAAAATE